MKKQNGEHYGRSARSNKSLNSQTNLTPNLSTLTQAFERLATIENPIAFHLEFEREQKALKLHCCWVGCDNEVVFYDRRNFGYCMSHLPFEEVWA